MKSYISTWRQLTNDPFVLDCILGYKIPFLCEPQQFSLPEQHFDSAETIEMQTSIAKLLTIGAIVTIPSAKAKFLSRIFLVPKKDGSKRLILNLKELNNFVENEHFKMEDYRSACSLISKNCFMAVLDLKDAYHLIPISVESQPYLCFSFLGKTYMYVCLPFGLCCAPRIFTKVLRPVLGELRLRGFKSVSFLDDFLLLGNTESECKVNVLETKKLLLSLGFMINTQKSRLAPSTAVDYLGFHFDSVKLTMSLPDDKIEKLLAKCKLVIDLNTKNKLSCQICAEMIGGLVAASPAIPYGNVYLRKLEMDKQTALTKNNNSFSGLLSLSTESLDDINWWLTNLKFSVTNFGNENYDLELHTDASMTGWGAVCSDSATNGKWSKSEKHLHINVLELKAILYGLQSFYDNNKRVLVRSDSSTAVAYINRYGGCRSEECQRIAKKIWQWCEARNCTIFASYIPGIYNNMADFQSRESFDNSDFMLGREFYKICIQKYGVPEIDLFATHLSRQCEKFISWRPDPKSVCVDAFTLSWTQFFYAFPPFALVGKVLRKVVQDKARGIVVAPYWPTQAWFPLLMELIEKPYSIFGNNENLLFCPYDRKPHMLSKNIQLIAGIISFNSIKE